MGPDNPFAGLRTIPAQTAAASPFAGLQTIPASPATSPAAAAPPSPPPAGLLARAGNWLGGEWNGLLQGARNVGAYYDAHGLPATAAQVGAGVAKGLGHTGIGLAKLVELARGPAGAAEMAADESTPGSGINRAERALAPANAPQGLGRGGEQFAEYLMPFGDEEKAIGAAADLAGGGKLARLVARSAVNAGTDATVAKVQGNNAAAAAAAGALGTALPEAVSAVVKKPVGALADAMRRALVGAPTDEAAELAAHAEAEGIPATAAQLTGARPLESVQITGQNSLLSGSHVSDRLKLAHKAARDAMARFVNRVAPAGADLESPEAAGATVQRALRSGIAAEKAAISDQFDEIEQLSDGIDVTPSATRSAIADVRKRAGNSLQGLLPRHALGVVDEIEHATEGEKVGWSQAQAWRSQLLDAGDMPGDAPNGAGVAIMRHLATALDADMEKSSAKLSPELLDKFRAANGAHRAMEEDFNNPLSPIYHAVKQQAQSESVPSAGVIKLLTPRSGGGSEALLGRVQHYLGRAGDGTAPEEVLRGAFIRQLGAKGDEPFNEPLFARQLSEYRSPYLAKLLASAEDAAWLKRHAVLAERIAKNVNPSGTGRAWQAPGEIAAMLASPLHPSGLSVPLGTALAGRVATSDALTRFALGAAPAAAQAPGRLAAAIREAAAAKAAGSQGH